MTDVSRKIEDLAFKDVVVVSDFLSASEVDLCVADFELARTQGEFARAGVGHGPDKATRDQIRRDSVLWLEEPGTTEARRLLFARFNALRDQLNGRLFLGLWSFEAHYAHYPAGGFYKRHVDVFRDDDARTISVVLYLNSSWRHGNGGELRVFTRDPQAPIITVEPHAGTLVCFLSRETEHEVLESKVDRRSFTGWFKRRSSSQGEKAP